jgi:chloramphenicol 3-O-phosphotransferase
MKPACLMLTGSLAAMIEPGRRLAACSDQLRNLRVLLIGGTSHVGKSALAQALAITSRYPWTS